MLVHEIVGIVLLALGLALLALHIVLALYRHRSVGRTRPIGDDGKQIAGLVVNENAYQALSTWSPVLVFGVVLVAVGGILFGGLSIEVSAGSGAGLPCESGCVAETPCPPRT